MATVVLVKTIISDYDTSYRSQLSNGGVRVCALQLPVHYVYTFAKWSRLVLAVRRIVPFAAACTNRIARNQVTIELQLSGS